jgi:Putative peptidoglycan binding domain
MASIQAPLREGDKGALVAPLHRAVSHLIHAGVIELSETDRDSVLAGLAVERRSGVFGPATLWLVATFQGANGLPPTGQIDEATAGALDAAVERLPTRPAVSIAQPLPETLVFHVAGKVASRVRAGVGGLCVRMLDRAVSEDLQLAEAVTDENGSHQATFSEAAFQKKQPDLQARVFAGGYVPQREFEKLQLRKSAQTPLQKRTRKGEAAS